ncbi:MAG: Fic family protein [Gordonibacter sp.]|nr:Fic family protein [Gordonibacter sp.]
MYKPVPIGKQGFVLSPTTQAAIARAESSMVRMEDRACLGGVDRALMHTLARVEAISTIRIEGKRPSLSAILYLEAYLEGNRAEGVSRIDSIDAYDFENDEARQAALEVLRFLSAVRYLYYETDPDQPLTPEVLLDIHSLCMYGAPACETGVQFRKKRYELSDADAAALVYAPPKPEDLPALLEDLCAFANKEVYAPIGQAAIAHFQFESIKPFKSGLDKTGRLMCHAIMRKRGLMRSLVAPIGLEPAIDTKSHAESLLPYNFGLASDECERLVLVNRWADFCAWSAEVSAKVTNVHLNAVITLRERWVEELGRPSKGSASEALIGLLPGLPVLTVKQAVGLTGKSISSVNDAFARLEAAGIIREADSAQRSRVFVAPHAVDLFDELDRKVAPLTPVSRDSFGAIFVS